MFLSLEGSSNVNSYTFSFPSNELLGSGMVLWYVGGEAYGRYLSQEDGALRMGLVPSYTEP